MDKENVIKGLEQCREGGSCDGCQFDTQSSKCIFLLHTDALALLKEQEAVVRCKDCKHWMRRECGSYGTCESENMSIFGFTDAEWYCADGERKET